MQSYKDRLAAQFILNPDSISCEALKQARKELDAANVGTVYQVPCIVTIFRHGKLIATATGNHQFESQDFSMEKPIQRLIDITIDAAIDTRLNPYVNQTLTRQDLTQLLEEIYE